MDLKNSINKVAGVTGLEPVKCQSQSLVPYRLGYTPMLGRA